MSLTFPLITAFRHPETADVPVCCAMADAHSVCHGVRPSFQQSPGGCRVSCVDLIVAGLDIDDYERTLLHRADLRLDLLLVDGFAQGRYLPGSIVSVCRSTLLLSEGKRPDSSKIRFPSFFGQSNW